MRLQLSTLLVVGLLSCSAWGADPTPAPSPTPTPTAIPETSPSQDPAAKFTPPKTYTAKKIAYIPLQIPAYLFRGLTYPVHELAKYLERSKVGLRLYDYFLKEDIVFYPILQAGGGDGFGGGVGFIARNMFDSGYRLSMNYAAYGDLDQRAKLTLSSPTHYIGEVPFDYKFLFRFRDKTDARFYGIGPQTPNIRTEYGYDLIRTGFLMEFDVLPTVKFTVPLQFLTERTRPEDDQGRPSVEQLFPPSQLTAFQDRTDYAIFGLEVLHDTRDSVNTPSRGGYRAFRFERYQGLNTNQFSFNEFEIDIRQYFRVWTPRHVFVVRNDWYFQQSTGDGGIPFELLRELDHRSPLRGFPSGRFRDSASVLFNFEYRYPVWDFIDGSIFVDTGKVFNGITNFNFDNWAYSVGGGFRLVYQDEIVMRVQAGYGGEGVVFLFRLGEDI